MATYRSLHPLIATDNTLVIPDLHLPIGENLLGWWKDDRFAEGASHQFCIRYAINSSYIRFTRSANVMINSHRKYLLVYFFIFLFIGFNSIKATPVSL